MIPVAPSRANAPAAPRDERESFWLGGRIFHVGSPPSVSATVWLIDAGRIAGIDVSSLVVVKLGGPAAASGSAQPSRVVGLIDERATPEQVWALVDLFRGDPGLPVGGLTGPAPIEQTYQVPIEYGARDGVWTFSVPDRLTVALPVPGPVWSRAPKWAGTAAELAVVMPEEGWTFHFEDCEASHAWFVIRSPMSRPKGSGTCE